MRDRQICNVTPTQTINSGLNGPMGIGIDNNGNVWNVENSGTAINAYSTINGTPGAVISGSNTTLFQPRFLTVSAPPPAPPPPLPCTAQWLFMADCDSTHSQIDRFCTSDTGNMAPRGIWASTSFGTTGDTGWGPHDIVTDGQYIYVSDETNAAIWIAPLSIIPTDGSTSTAAAPLSISGTLPGLGASTTEGADPADGVHGIWWDNLGNLWAANPATDEVLEFSATQISLSAFRPSRRTQYSSVQHPDGHPWRESGFWSGLRRCGFVRQYLCYVTWRQ